MKITISFLHLHFSIKPKHLRLYLVIFQCQGISGFVVAVFIVVQFFSGFSQAIAIILSVLSSYYLLSNSYFLPQVSKVQ